MNQSLTPQTPMQSPPTGATPAYSNQAPQQVPYLAPQGQAAVYNPTPQPQMGYPAPSPYTAPQYPASYSQQQVASPYQAMTPQGYSQTAVMAQGQVPTAVMATQPQLSQPQPISSPQQDSNPWQQAFHGLLDRTLGVLSTPVRFPGLGQSSPSSPPSQDSYTNNPAYPAQGFSQIPAQHPVMNPAPYPGSSAYSQPLPAQYNPYSQVGALGQNVALGVTPGTPGIGRADGFPSAQEVLTQVDAGDLNRYACGLEDALQQHQVALQMASGENLKLREMLINPDHLTNWTQYMFGQGGPFDVSADPQYQQFVSMWNAAGQVSGQEPNPFGLDPNADIYYQQFAQDNGQGGAQGGGQFGQVPNQFNPQQVGYQSPLFQPGSSVTSLEEQAMQQQLEMQQQLVASQQTQALQAQQTQPGVRQGFPAPPTPAVGSPSMEQFRQAFYATPPEQRAGMIAQIQQHNPNLIRQMAAGMFQF